MPRALHVSSEDVYKLATDVKEKFGYTSYRDAVENSLLLKLSTYDNVDTFDDKFSSLQKTLTALRSTSYKAATDDEINAIRSELSGGL